MTAARRLGAAGLVAAGLAVRLTLYLTVTLLLCSVAPTVLGWKSFVIMSGSMTPRLEPGDVVVAQPTAPDRVVIGQIVVVDDPARPGTTLSHRVVGRTANGSFITRGDANAVPDSTPVTVDRLRGVLRLRVPAVGLPFLWWGTRQYAYLVVAVLVAALLLVLMVIGVFDPQIVRRVVEVGGVPNVYGGSYAPETSQRHTNLPARGSGRRRS